MATIIKASRLDNYITFTAHDQQRGSSRKLLVLANDLWDWLNRGYTPNAFSVCDYGDCLRFSHGLNDVILASFTTWNFLDNDGHIAGHTLYADLPQSFFADLYDEGEARFVAAADVPNQHVG